MSLDAAGMTFCVVCGRFDRELVQRKSGLKCHDCVGRRSKRDYSALQQQQATFMLLSMSSGGGTAGRSLVSPRDSSSNPASPMGGAGTGSGNVGGRSPALGPSPVAIAQDDLIPANAAPPVRVNLEEIVVSVENPTTVSVDVDKLTIPIVGAAIKAQQTITFYDFVTRRRYCPHETVATTLPGSSMGSFSLKCPDCSRPLALRRHRYSHALRVFTAVKNVGKEALPSLPAKRLISRFSGDFIQQRRRAMEDFVQACMCNSFFARHPQLLELLGLEEDRHAFEADAAAGGGDDAATSSPTAPAELSTRLLQGWKRGALIGKGAFGEVFLGLLPNSQLVAVKVVRLGSVDGSELDALQSELAMLRGLYHPNIVPLLGALKQRDDGSAAPAASGDCDLCIFTEYVECGSIARMVRKFGALPFPVIQRYLRQVLLGLTYLHEQSVVHRDIKGDNILVAKDGTVKLADFGCSAQLARLAEAADSGAATGGMVANLTGTPLWMSPEAMRGEPLGTSTDVWSVGCVGIEMLGRPPWKMGRAENVYTAMFRFQKAKSLPDGFPTEDEAPASYRDFLECCLRRSPDDRPTAQQLLMHPFFGDELLVDAGDDDLVPDGPFASPKVAPATPAIPATPLSNQSSPNKRGGANQQPRADPSPLPPAAPAPTQQVAAAGGRDSPDIVL